MTTTIDATNLILGKLSTTVAKRALLGEKIDIVNCEKAIITGKKSSILNKYKEKAAKGNVHKGPFFPKMADRFVRRTIRGMLPYKQEKGKKAFKNIMCYLGVPENFKDAKLESIESLSINKSKALNHVKVGEICKLIGK